MAPADLPCDGDGLWDGKTIVVGATKHYGEWDYGTSALMADTDGDGLSDFKEAFKQDFCLKHGSANAKIPVGYAEPGTCWQPPPGYSSLSGYTDPLNPDTDGDGLLDGAEQSDGQTITLTGYNDVIQNIWTNPAVADTDGDGKSDGTEINGWQLKVFYYVSGNIQNYDRTVQSNPLNEFDIIDSDGDNIPDPKENDPTGIYKRYYTEEELASQYNAYTVDNAPPEILNLKVRTKVDWKCYAYVACKVDHTWSWITAEVWDPAGIEKVKLGVTDRSEYKTLEAPSWGGQTNDFGEYIYGIYGIYEVKIESSYWKDYLVDYEVRATVWDTNDNTVTIKKQIDGVITGAIKAIASLVLAVMKAAWDAAVSLVNALIEWITSEVGKLLDTIMNIVSSLIQNYAKGIVIATENAIAAINKFENTDDSTEEDIVKQDTFNVLINIVSIILAMVGIQVVDPALVSSYIQQFISTFFELLSPFIEEMNSILEFIEPFLSFLSEGVTKFIFENIIGVIPIINTLFDTIGDLKNKVNNFVADTIVYLIEKIIPVVFGTSASDVLSSDGVVKITAILNFITYSGIFHEGSIIHTLAGKLTDLTKAVDLRTQVAVGGVIFELIKDTILSAILLLFAVDDKSIIYSIIKFISKQMINAAIRVIIDTGFTEGNNVRKAGTLIALWSSLIGSLNGLVDTVFRFGLIALKVNFMDFESDTAKFAKIVYAVDKLGKSLREMKIRILMLIIYNSLYIISGQFDMMRYASPQAGLDYTTLSNDGKTLNDNIVSSERSFTKDSIFKLDRMMSKINLDKIVKRVLSAIKHPFIIGIIIVVIIAEWIFLTLIPTMEKTDKVLE